MGADPESTGKPACSKCQQMAQGPPHSCTQKHRLAYSCTQVWGPSGTCTRNRDPMHMHMDTGTCLCMHVHIHAHMCTHTATVCMCAHMLVHIHTHTHTFARIHVLMHMPTILGAGWSICCQQQPCAEVTQLHPRGSSPWALPELGAGRAGEDRDVASMWPPRAVPPGL